MKKSIQPKKQRNARRDAPMHTRKKLMHANIASALKTKLGTKLRNILVKKGDKVKITTGSFKKKEGKVLSADYSKLKVFVEGVSRLNARGQQKLIPFDPSNIQIIDGDFTTKDRKAILARCAKASSSVQNAKVSQNKS